MLCRIELKYYVIILTECSIIKGGLYLIINMKGYIGLCF